MVQVLSKVCVLSVETKNPIEWVLGLLPHLYFLGILSLCVQQKIHRENSVHEPKGNRATPRETQDSYGVVWPQRKCLFEGLNCDKHIKIV